MKGFPHLRVHSKQIFALKNDGIYITPRGHSKMTKTYIYIHIYIAAPECFPTTHYFSVF